MPHVSVFVEPEDVLDEMSDDELIEELKSRKKFAEGVEEGKEAPWHVREIVWQVIGRVL